MCAVDVTPRRCQDFVPQANATYVWMNLEQGYIDLAVCGANGVLTIPGFLVTPTGNTLAIYKQ